MSWGVSLLTLALSSAWCLDGSWRTRTVTATLDPGPLYGGSNERLRKRGQFLWGGKEGENKELIFMKATVPFKFCFSYLNHEHRMPL